MEVTLYTTFCPKCRVLEAKLKQKNIQYKEVSDMDTMTEKGFMSVPMLQVGETIYDFTAANNWINNN